MTFRKTIRLLFPQWQGGNNPDYMLGAQLLAWLAPPVADPLVEVSVAPPTDEELPLEGGVLGGNALLAQLKTAKQIIADHQPARIISFGGDCLIEQAPFAYLSARYGRTFGILWIDAHPDVATPKERNTGHTMVLGHLLGQGDAQFAEHVETPVAPARVMLAGLGRLFPPEAAFIEQHGIPTASPDDLRQSSRIVLDWLQSAGIEQLAIHLDLDVLSPDLFRSLSFADPKIEDAQRGTLRTGSLDIPTVIRLIQDVSDHADVVGLGITEHIPWDAISLKRMMSKMPIFSD